MNRRLLVAAPVAALTVAATTGWAMPHSTGWAHPRHPHGTPSPTPTVTPAPTPTPTSSPTVYTVPATVPHDCSTAADQQITSWLATVPNGATARFAAGSCYAMTGAISITDRSNLIIDGNGATFKATGISTPNAPWWTITAGSNITVENMTVQGPDTGAGVHDGADHYKGVDYEWQHAYSFDGTQGGTLDNVQAYNIFGDFVEADFDPRGPLAIANNPPARNILVENSHFDGNGRMGIGLTDVDGFTLRSSYLANINQGGIDLELDADYETGRNILITGNTFGLVRFALLANSGAGDGNAISNVSFTNNTMTGALYGCRPPVDVYGASTGPHRSGYTVTGNTLVAYGDAFDFTYADDITVDSNTVTYKNGGCGGAGVGLSNANTARITNNAFVGFHAVVQQDSTDSNVTVSGNRLS